jgi:hypothetical protein
MIVKFHFLLLVLPLFLSRIYPEKRFNFFLVNLLPAFATLRNWSEFREAKETKQKDLYLDLWNDLSVGYVRLRSTADYFNSLLFGSSV